MIRRARWAVAASVAMAAGATVLAVVPAVAPVGASVARTPRWTQRSVPAASGFGLRSVVCTGSGCVAMAQQCSPGACGSALAGRAFSSPDRGATWVEGGFASGAYDPGALGCGSATLCVVGAVKGTGAAAGGDVLVSSDAGSTFASHGESAYRTGAAACASREECLVLATTPKDANSTTTTLRTTDGGSTWSAVGFGAKGDDVAAVSCGRPSVCVSVGSSASGKPVAFTSSNDGAAWHAAKLPKSLVGGLGTVSCDGSTCIATATTQAVLSRDGGRSWSVRKLPVNDDYRAGSCLTATTCVLVGWSLTGRESPVAVLTKDGGKTWLPQALPAGSGSLVAVDCTAGGCVAVGERLVYAGAVPTQAYPLVITY